LYAFVVATGAAVLSENYSELKRASGAFERIIELFDVGHLTEETAQDNSRPTLNAGAIQFQSVSFSYPEKTNTPAVHRLSLSVQPGETLAIVGPSGSGKSTLFQLLTRMYPLTEGTICIDGMDIEQLSRGAVREMVAVVEQSPTLFSDTVAENIAVGRLEATDEAITRAAKLANAHEFIVELPQGYNTILGEHGLSLSGGQRQRIAIARAMLKNAPILLLDEATSALDAESEHLLRNLFSGKSAEQTTMVIAHRLSTIRHADKIVFMEKGQLVEQGTHEQLVAQKGRYARYLKLQNTQDIL
nr:ATP-binding cassette domain-containing protein [Gammaproteobacteria bacterium]